MHRDRRVRLICGVLIAASVLLSGVLSTQITAEAGRSQLVYTDAAEEGDPPEVALGIAMGAFRGLFVNYLWMRATKLKEEGKFYEAIELSSAITRLQPRFPRVWAFHAWNMAYNISVATNTAPERWQWVQAGVKLLAKEGIPRNPNEVLLYKELAWIYLHKIQGWSDDANRFYKRRMAEEWTIILGTPPLLPDDTKQATETMAAWFAQIADAPTSLDEAIRDELEDKRGALGPGDDASAITSTVQELAVRIREEAGLKLDMELLRLITLLELFRTPRMADVTLKHQWDAVSNSVLAELWKDEKYRDAWSRLLPVVRRQVIVDEYNMDPERMLRYIRKFGPLDWRHPASHAVYWSNMGVEEGLERRGTTTFDTLNTDRVTVHAIQELFRTGTIVYDLATDEFFTLVDLHWVDAYGDFLDEFVARAGISQDPTKRAMTTTSEGYQNFLKDVIRTFYRLGRYEQAQKYYDRLRTFPRININDPDLMNELKLPLDEFVRKQMKDRVGMPHVAAGEVYSALMDGYIRGFVMGDVRAFERQFEYAREVHKLYFREQPQDTITDTKAARMEEMSRDFTEVAAVAFLRLLRSGQIQAPFASRIYKQAPLAIQQWTYDVLAADFTAQAPPDMSPEDIRAGLERIFPEPPGMAEFREMRRRAAEQGREGMKEGLEFEKK